MDPLWGWLAAIALGLFHGVNPGMGWLFAVSNGLQAGRAQAVWTALLPIGGGHFLAMAAVLLPAAVAEVFVSDRFALQTVAAVLLIGFGLYKLIKPRHPRALVRVGPGRLTLWSFLMASAHGAGLMLLPVFFGMAARNGDHMHHAAGTMSGGVTLGALLVALHTLAMIAAAGAVAWLVFRYLGLRLLQKTWLNLDVVWAGALIAVGAIALLA